MDERHVTRAGERIGLAQPSMSSVLTRLRALFGDELFVRSASGMQPTAKALALIQPIGDALAQIRGALAPTPTFDPATARRRLSIAATDYGDLVVVPPLVKALRRAAPGIDLVVRPIIDPVASVTSLERGDVDVLIGGHLPASPRVTRCTLFTENFVCVRDTKRAEGKARTHEGRLRASSACAVLIGRRRRVTGRNRHDAGPARTQAPDGGYARPCGRGAICSCRNRSRGDHGRAHRAPLREGRGHIRRSSSLRCGGIQYRPPSHATRDDRPGAALAGRIGQSCLQGNLVRSFRQRAIQQSTTTLDLLKNRISHLSDNQRI